MSRRCISECVEIRNAPLWLCLHARKVIRSHADAVFEEVTILAQMSAFIERKLFLCASANSTQTHDEVRTTTREGMTRFAQCFQDHKNRRPKRLPLRFFQLQEINNLQAGPTRYSIEVFPIILRSLDICVDTSTWIRVREQLLQPVEDDPAIQCWVFHRSKSRGARLGAPWSAPDVSFRLKTATSSDLLVTSSLVTTGHVFVSVPGA